MGNKIKGNILENLLRMSCIEQIFLKIISNSTHYDQTKKFIKAELLVSLKFSHLKHNNSSIYEKFINTGLREYSIHENFMKNVVDLEVPNFFANPDLSVI